MSTIYLVLNSEALMNLVVPGFYYELQLAFYCGSLEVLIHIKSGKLTFPFLNTLYQKSLFL